MFEPLIQFFKTLDDQKDTLKSEVNQGKEEDKDAIFDLSFKQKTLDQEVQTDFDDVFVQARKLDQEVQTIEKYTNPNSIEEEVQIKRLN